MNKRFPRARQFLLWLVGACLFVGCVQFIILTIVTRGATLQGLVVNATPTPVEETIGLPVNTSQEVFTSQQYSGYVTITIQGEGWIDVNTRHNAFHSFTADGLVEGFHGFLIDGESLLLRVFTVFPPPVEGMDDEYRFLYYVDEQPRRVAFQMVNGNADDSSVFTVEITSQNLISPRGR